MKEQKYLHLGNNIINREHITNIKASSELVEIHALNEKIYYVECHTSDDSQKYVNRLVDRLEKEI